MIKRKAPDHDKNDEKEPNAKEQHRRPRKTSHRGFVEERDIVEGLQRILDIIMIFSFVSNGGLVKERKQINIEQLQH